MNGSALDLDPAHERSSPTWDGVLLNELSELSWNSEVRRPSVDLAVKPQDKPCIRTTEPGGVFDERRADRLQIERRAADHLEHFTRGGLLFQGLGEITVTLLQFLEQSHVLDCDYGLVGEGFQKSNLLIGKWADFKATNKNCADRCPLTEQRSTENSPDSELRCIDFAEWILRSRFCRLYIVYMDHFPVYHRSAGNPVTRNGNYTRNRCRDRNMSPRCNPAHYIVLDTIDL